MEAGTTGFNEGVRRLAQYRPFEQSGQGLLDVLASLTLAAAELNDGAFDSLAECQRAFSELWGLDVEIEELRAISDQLEEAGLAKPERGGFALTESARNGLRARAADSEDAEKTALSQWESSVRGLRPDLTAEDLDCLGRDLSEWLSKIVARHGAEAALMLYPEEPRAHKLFDQIESLGTDFLPERSDAVMKVRDDALKVFVRRPTPEQRTFLANRLNTAFYLTVLTLDPAARSLVEQQASGTRLYLDTNVLYAVLGMAPPQEVVAAHRLLKLSKDLGYQLAVTPWTIRELQESIERARKNVEVHGQTFNAGIARLMLQTTGEKGATNSYWKNFMKSAITPKDFFERVSAFEDDLAAFGIERVEEGCSKVDGRDSETQEYASLLERMLWGQRYRHPNVIEHDAKHRLLVERLRGEGTNRFSTTKAWFLTQDTKLPRYASMMPEPDQDPPKLPFCISPSSWAQIVRAMTPRTDDWEEMVVELLASPFLGYQGPLNQKAVKEVVARMDTYEGASPELALAVVQDSAMLTEIAEAAPGEVEERVRAAYGTKARELQEQATESARIAAEEKAAREAAEERARATQEDLASEIRRREAADRDRAAEERRRQEAEKEFDRRLERVREESAAEVRRVQKAHDSLESKVEKDREDREREAAQRKRRIEIGLSIVVGLLAVCATALLISLRVLRGTVPIVLAVVAGALLLGLAINRALPRPWGGTVMNWIWGLTSVAGIALAVLLDD